LLAPVLREGINLVNAMHVAKQRGIRIQETRLPAPENFTNLIVIELRTDVESHRVSGTVFTDKLPRIVNVDGYPLEVVPHGNMIFFTNNDKPGVIGGIGTVLGKCNVNIAGMHLGRETQGGKALALLLVDDPVSNDVIEQFRQIPNILSAKVVHVYSRALMAGYFLALFLAASPILIGRITDSHGMPIPDARGRMLTVD